MPIRSLARAYFLLQGLAGLGWWGMLLAAPGTRGVFAAPGEGETALLSLAPADVALYVAGSFAAAWVLGRPCRAEVTAAVLWFTAGAVAYATLAAVGLATIGGAPWTGALLMLPSAALTLGLAVAVARGGAR